MEIFDKKFNKREEKYRRNYEIDYLLYEKLEDLSKYYEASIADLVNTCIEELIKSENINLYEKDENQLAALHTFYIRDSNIKGLDNLKNKYSISISKLVDIAIRNIIG